MHTINITINNSREMLIHCIINHQMALFWHVNVTDPKTFTLKSLKVCLGHRIQLSYFKHQISKFTNDFDTFLH